MKFGFDIDDTLISLREHAFHIYNRKLEQTIPIDVFHKIEQVEIHEVFGLTEEKGFNMWNSSLEEIYYTSCPPYPDAVETLVELSKQGHEIYYITARSSDHGERTKKWMMEQGFPLQQDHFFCGMKDQEKAEIIQSLQLDYYFDDKPEVLHTLSDDSLKVYVMNQSYNQHLTIPRITNWSQLNEIIKCNIMSDK
ncbi:HAD family acid phosphatase [Paenisporosarcina sp. TG20]|uniref:5' nucleotidase, NT5C type n=1 Tax=Paenisporosarcina sp. TG20 TaxID=1211706 RepID=UPI0003118749|nr:HAD family acid phosphatase [Paenisporosarcina sp. TG20]